MFKVAVLLALVAVCAAVAPFHSNGDVVADQYIVVLKEGVNAASHHAFLATFDHTIKHKYTAAMAGYAATFSKDVLTAVLARDDVKYVEADQMMHASCTTQNAATWGIVRTNIEDLSEMSNDEYIYETAIGAGVDNYVVDTGIYHEHLDFNGRAFFGANTVDKVNTDENGHGTHVAGTIGGTTWGLAKGTTLFSVKVLNKQGSGTNSGVIAGVDYVATAKRKTGKPSVANMSLGGGKSNALNDACDNVVKQGVIFAVAAGNDNRDSCSYSPASADLVITVGSTALNKNPFKDARSSFSNWGTCVDIFAPGSDITSTWIGNNKATATISGTSMACPHVAGVVTKVLDRQPTLTPAQALAAINNGALQGVISDVRTGSPNRLLHDSCISK